jgi:uncharacterized protein (DUF1800 family)
MSLEPFRGDFGTAQAALLARRTMFGASTEQIQYLASQGLEATLEHLFGYSLEPHSDNPFKPAAHMEESEQVQLTQRRWLFEMIHSEQPFREKLALFWTNHFVIGVDKVRKATMLLHYLDTLYTHGLSSFYDLTLATSKTPAMLRYLDNNQNKKASPNENFARELLELFTLGIGHYSEEDVSAAARAFTGWTYDGKSESPNFIFNEKQHDTLGKTFLGETGKFTGEDIIERCARHEATSYFISQKIWRSFVSSTVDKSSVEALAQTFRETQGDLKAVFREVFSSHVFYKSSGQLIKGPLDYVVGTLRSFGIEVLEQEKYKKLQQILAGLGQVPLAPPHVAGWAGGRNWISDSTLLSRINWAREVARKDRLFPQEATATDINIALFGSEQSPVEAHLENLKIDERVFMLLVSPDYMVS